MTEGMGMTKPAFYISLLGLAVNIPANYIFINGLFGLPAYGGAGCGIATAIVLTVMALVAAKSLIVPLQAEFFALEGVSQLIKTVDRVKEKLNPKLKIC